MRPPHVVLPIGEHVEEQPDGYSPAPPRQVTVTPIGQTAHEGVEHNGGIGMEGMKADAHAVGGEDGRGQQVVEIDEHGGEHDEIGFATLAVGEKQQRKEERGEEMQAVVDDGAEGVKVHGRDDLERWDEDGCRRGRHAKSGRLPRWKRQRQEQSYSFSPRATMNVAV